MSLGEFVTGIGGKGTGRVGKAEGMERGGRRARRGRNEGSENGGRVEWMIYEREE